MEFSGYTGCKEKPATTFFFFSYYREQSTFKKKCTSVTLKMKSKVFTQGVSQLNRLTGPKTPGTPTHLYLSPQLSRQGGLQHWWQSLKPPHKLFDFGLAAKGWFQDRTSIRQSMEHARLQDVVLLPFCCWIHSLGHLFIVGSDGELQKIQNVEFLKPEVSLSLFQSAPNPP